MYFICGSEKFLIEQQLENIKKENSTKLVESFDFSEDKNITSLLLSLNSQQLFSTSKIYIINSLPYFPKAPAKSDQRDANELLDLLRTNNTDVFVFVNEEIDNKTKISKNKFTDDFFNHNQPVVLYQALPVDNASLFRMVQNMVKKYDAVIEDDAVNLLLLKVSNNLNMLEKEVFKLAHENKNITLQMVDKSVEYVYQEDPFGFINSFESNDFALIWQKYKEKIFEGAEITGLIGQLSQVLILAHQIYAYIKCNKSVDDLSKDLNINSYRIKKISFLLNKLGIIKIKKMILHLAAIDKMIKDGTIEDKVAFERFLIKYFY